MIIFEYLDCILLLIGVLFIAIGTIGLLRLPDFFCRAHALTKAMTLGISLVLFGGMLYLGPQIAGFKLLVAIILQYVTIPLSGHILGNIAFQKNIPRHKHQAVADHRIKTIK